MVKKTLFYLIIALMIQVIYSSCFAKDDSIKMFRLSNGHIVVIKEVHTNPIVTIDSWIKTGSINENPKNNGVSHFLEHLLFKGTTHHKAGEVDKILESKGAVFNAATSKDFTHFYTTISSKYADLAVDLQADMLLNATIPEDELRRERKVVQEEIRRSLDNPQVTVYNNMNDIIFKKHPYKYETLGSIENIENIPRNEILKYYHKWYVPSNTVTVVVGDVDTDKILPVIKQKFDSKSQTIVKFPSYQPEPELAKSEEKFAKGGYNSGYLMMGFKGVPISDKKENYALDIAASVLGGGNSSRLYQNLKSETNLVTSVSAEHQSLKDDSIFMVGADLKPENYKLVKSIIFNEINKLKSQPISESELKRAKTQMERDFIYNNESVENVAGSLGYSMAVGGSLDYYTDYISDVNKITAKDVQNALIKYVRADKMAISVLAPESSSNNLYKSEETYKNISKKILNNGITLLSDKNGSDDIVSMSLFIKGGKLTETVAGTSDIIAETLKKGTTTKSELEIAQELEDNGIIISPSAGSDYFIVNLKSTKNDFDKALSILADILNNPVFKSSDIEKAKDDIISSIMQSRDVPLSYAYDNLLNGLYPDHPYGYTGTRLEKSLSKISREQIQEYYRQYFIPQNMIFSISGKYNEEDLINKIYAYFPPREGKRVEIQSLEHKFIHPEKNKFISAKKDSSAASLAVGWNTGGIVNDKEFASLKIINSVLGSGLSSRLFREMRAKKGMAYVVSSAYPSRLDNSFFMLYIGTKPENVIGAKADFLNEINRIKKEGISAEELKEAKDRLTGQFELSQETGQEKALSVGSFEALGKGYKFNFEYPKLIESVTSEDIIRTANKYFNNPYVISIVAPSKIVDNLEEEYKSESKR